MSTKVMPRKGLRVRCLNIKPYLRKECIEFTKWLRNQLEFPIRVVIYIKNDMYIKNMYGELVNATFFAPDEKNVEPYIRIATGDVEEIRKKTGKVNAFCNVLCSIAHEIAHYEQWIEDKELSEELADKRAIELMDLYGYVTDNN